MRIVRQGVVGKMADIFMLPIMYLLQGNIREVPQRTHRWNNQHMNNNSVRDLQSEMIVFADGQPTAHRRWLGPIPLFHMPIFGGWKKFIVIEPTQEIEEWFVGWVAFDALGLSKIPLTGPVRLGVGPRQAEFFGLAADGVQIPLRIVGEGVIGKAGHFSHIPLL